MSKQKITPEQERQIARLIGMGWTLQLIADEIGVSKNAVWKHTKKLGIRSEYVGGHPPKSPFGTHHPTAKEDRKIEYVTGQKSWQREE